MMNKIVLILIFLVSFNSYARVYEYDIELIPIKDKNYHTCYNTILKIGDPNKILGIYLEDSETCEEFLAFNEMIKDSHPEKARLPFHGQIKGINFEDRISFIEYYDHGQLNTIEYFKNGNLVNSYIPGEEIVSHTYRDDEKKTKLIKVYTNEKNLNSLWIDDEKVLEFKTNENDEPLIIKQNINNTFFDLKTFKFKISLYENNTIDYYASYSEIYESFNLTIFHKDKLKSRYYYEMKKRDNEFNYRVRSISFYNNNETVLNIRYWDDDFVNYDVTIYLKSNGEEFRWSKKRNSKKWECWSVNVSKRVHNSNCQNIDQTMHANILENYFNNYNYPLYPEKLFKEFGFK